MERTKVILICINLSSQKNLHSFLLNQPPIGFSIIDLKSKLSFTVGRINWGIFTWNARMICIIQIRSFVGFWSNENIVMWMEITLKNKSSLLDPQFCLVIRLKILNFISDVNTPCTSLM